MFETAGDYLSTNYLINKSANFKPAYVYTGQHNHVHV